MVSHHVYIGLLLLVAAILAILTGVFYTFSQADVTKIPEHDAGNQSLRNASGNLLVAYVLAYVAGGLLLLLSIVYFLQGSLNWNEITHTIIFLLIFVVLIISVIFGFLALSDIDDAGNIEKKNTVNWIWAGFGVAIAAILMIIISGAWRFQHVQSQKSKQQQLPAPAQTFTSSRSSGQPGSPNYSYVTSYETGPEIPIPPPTYPMTPASLSSPTFAV